MTENEIVRANEGLAHCITKRYKDRADYDDILQEARIGILQAARKYDPTRAAFSTYAAQWIRSRVGRYFGTQEDSVLSLDDSAGEETSIIDTIEDPNENGIERSDAKLVAESALDKLPPRAVQAFRLRGQGYTFQGISDKLGYSRARAEQVIRKYSNKMKGAYNED